MWDGLEYKTELVLKERLLLWARVYTWKITQSVQLFVTGIAYMKHNSQNSFTNDIVHADRQ